MDLTEERFISEWFTHFGIRRGYSLLGWSVRAMVAAPAGADRRWMLESGPGGRSARYANVAALDGFGDYLRSRGYDLGDAPLPLGRPVAMASAH